MQTHIKTLLFSALSYPSTLNEVMNMFNFWKKRREAEQQRNVDQQIQFMEEMTALYTTSGPTNLADELKAVSASIEQGRREDPPKPE